MNWEHLTAPDFAQAVRDTGGVCVLPIGVLEKHADHLPLGTDALLAHRVATLAAKREPAVVFPLFYFGQIFEARCYPGTFAVPPRLLYDVVQATLDEMGRNGFRKIVIHNGHGGNWHLLQYLAQAALHEPKPYTIYVQTSSLTAGRKDEWNALMETKLHGHACECETSCMLAAFPDLVRMDKAQDPEPGADQARNSHLPDAFTGIWFYSRFPNHYAGDARTATAEKGRKLVQLMVDSLADFIAAVKADTVMPGLEREFFERERALR